MRLECIGSRKTAMLLHASLSLRPEAIFQQWYFMPVGLSVSEAPFGSLLRSLSTFFWRSRERYP